MRDRMKAMQGMTQKMQQNPMGSIQGTKVGTGKRLSPKERAAAKKDREKEKRKRDRDKKKK